MNITPYTTTRNFDAITDPSLSRKSPATSLDSIPPEVTDRTFQFIANPIPYSINKEIQGQLGQIYCVRLDQAWEKLQNSSQHSPIIASYLEEIPRNLTPEKKFKALYTRMLKDAKSLNSEKKSSWFSKSEKTPKFSLPENPAGRVLDPKLYLELAKEMEDISLKRVWTRIHSLLPISVSEDASAEQIRMCINDPRNQAAIQSVTVLNLKGLNLGTLPQEIRLFTGLLRLDAPSSNIQILPENILENCPQLLSLNFSHNQLQRLPGNLLQNCPLLIILEFNHNQLQRLPSNLLQNCSQLQALNFSHNQLPRIPGNLVQNCPLLCSLEFSHNQLQRLPKNLVQNCSQLQALDFSHNQLQILPGELAQNCSQLKALTFSHNQLQRLPKNLVQNCSQLQILDFNYNQLQTLPGELVQNCPQLRTLAFSHNQLQRIQESFVQNCRELQKVLFSNNSLAFVSNNLFQNCPDLQIADFSYNSAFSPTDRLFQNCPKMMTQAYRFARNNYRFKKWVNPTKLNHGIFLAASCTCIASATLMGSTMATKAVQLISRDGSLASYTLTNLSLINAVGALLGNLAATKLMISRKGFFSNTSRAFQFT